MKRLIFIALILPVALAVAGQSLDVDSLVNRLNTQQLTKAEQIELFYKIYETYVSYDLDNAYEYAKQGLALAVNEKNKLMASKFNTAFGRIYATKTDYETAMIYFEKALELAKAAKNEEQEAAIYQGIGIIYARQNNYVPALDYFLKALSICEGLGMKRECVFLLSNIATMNRGMRNDERALYYLERAKIIAEEIENARGMMQIYFELGAIHYYFASDKNDAENFEMSLEYALKAHKISQEINDLDFRGAITEILIFIYSQYVKDFEMATKYANERLQVAQEWGDPKMIASAWLCFSNLYLYQERWGESINAALAALAIDSTDVSYNFNLFQNLLLASICLNDNSKAYDYYLKFYASMIEKISQNDRETLADMEFKYETEKKEMRIASLEKERRLYVWLGVVGVFLAASLGFVLLLTVRNARRKRQLVANESVQEGEIGERTRIAKDLHDRLGGSLSAVKIGLRNAESLLMINDKIDMCMKELREIMNNVMPISLQKSGMKGALEDFSATVSHLRFHFFGENVRINSNLEYTVYCCARELVNNALKHSGATNINLQLIQSRKHVSLTVQDDGCGFDEKTVEKGNGLENIRNRVSSCQGKLDIFTAPGKGTETVIELKVDS